MKKFNILIAIFALVFFSLPSHVFALGQMTEPIVISSAVRGESIEQELIAVNSEKREVRVRYIAEGDIAGWADFYLSGDKTTSYDEFVIEAGGTLRVLAVINVPEDAANGEYLGSLSISNIPKEMSTQETSGSDVVQKIDREVRITVSDEEIVDISKTSIIPNKYDLEENEAFSIRVIYDNQGNIRVSPQIRLTITKDDQTVQDLIYPFPANTQAINSKSQLEIDPIVIQTLGWEKGKYRVNMSFLRADEELLKKDFNFSIVSALEKSEGESLKSNMGIYLGIIPTVAVMGALAAVIKRKRQK